MKTGDLRKSLFLSAKVLNLTRALDTFQVGKGREGGRERERKGGREAGRVPRKDDLTSDRARGIEQEMKSRGRRLTREECNTLLYVCQEAGGAKVRGEGSREGGIIGGGGGSGEPRGARQPARRSPTNSSAGV
jgi:hypothetical protein